MNCCPTSKVSRRPAKGRNAMLSCITIGTAIWLMAGDTAYNLDYVQSVTLSKDGDVIAIQKMNAEAENYDLPPEWRTQNATELVRHCIAEAEK